MRKIVIILLSIFLAGLALAGCTGNNVIDEEVYSIVDVVPVEVAPEESTSEEIAAEESMSAVQLFLDEYGDEFRADFAIIAMLLGDGASIDIVAGEGEELVFVFAHSPDMETDALSEALEGLISSLIPVLEFMADELGARLGIDEFTITVRHTDYAGNVLAEESFLAS